MRRRCAQGLLCDASGDRGGRLRRFLLASVLAMLMVSSSFAQETLGPRIEITGVNPVALPRVSVMVNAFDDFGQPLPGLVTENFRVVGDLAEHVSVADVVSFSDEKAVPISVVLAIDVSTSMAGTPINKAKEAASAFVNTMADDDPVAILTFLQEAASFRISPPGATSCWQLLTAWSTAARPCSMMRRCRPSRTPPQLTIHAAP